MQPIPYRRYATDHRGHSLWPYPSSAPPLMMCSTPVVKVKSAAMHSASFPTSSMVPNRPTARSNFVQNQETRHQYKGFSGDGRSRHHCNQRTVSESLLPGYLLHYSVWLIHQLHTFCEQGCPYISWCNGVHTDVLGTPTRMHGPTW